MPVKLKKGSKAAKDYMAKIRAMRGTGGKHTDTKSHNVNVRVVSGNIGALPFTGKFLGVDIKATKEPSGVRLDIGKTRMGINKNTDTFNAVADFINTVEKQSGRKLSVIEIEKGMKAAKPFIVSLKKEAPSMRSKANKKIESKSATSFRQTGTSVKSKDKQRTALAPGKRTTGKGKSKHTYYERRANRSDKPGQLLGVHKNAPPVYTQTIKLNQSQINDSLHWYERWNKLLNDYKIDLKAEKDPIWKKFYKNEIKQISAVCKSLKSNINSLRKIK